MILLQYKGTVYRTGILKTVLIFSVFTRYHRPNNLISVHPEFGGQLTMVLECFHLVSLLRILRRLMQEKRFRQQKAWLSPLSWNKSPHRISQTSPSNSHVDASGFYQCHTIIMVANELMLIFYQYQTANINNQFLPISNSQESLKTIIHKSSIKIE